MLQLQKVKCVDVRIEGKLRKSRAGFLGTQLKKSLGETNPYTSKR